MRSASAATLAILNGTAMILRADLYTITLVNGLVLRFTDADIPLTVAGQTYLKGPVITRSSTKQSIGIAVDSVTVTIGDDGSTLVSGLPIIQQIAKGLFRGAKVEVAKLFLASFDDTSPGAVPWFTGMVSETEAEFGSAELTVNSVTELLNQQMPRESYQPTCNNTLFDSSCGLSRAAYTTTATVTAGFTPTTTKFKHSGTLQANTYFALGKATFTTGANAGQARTIKSYTSGVVEFFYPLAVAPALADAVTIVPGCDKLDATCTTKFNNRARLKATPYVPVPETAVGSSTSAGVIGSPGGTGSGSSGSVSTSVRGAGKYVA